MESFTHIFFDSTIILIFEGLFLHRLSRILKVNLNWLRVPTTDFARQKFRTRRDNKSSSNPSWKARKKTSKEHTKNRPFGFCIISKDRICNILSSRVESSEQVGFESDGSSVIVDKSENYQILPEKDMFTDKIEPIIYNGVANIGGKDIITKGIGPVIWYWTDD